VLSFLGFGTWFGTPNGMHHSSQFTIKSIVIVPLLAFALGCEHMGVDTIPPSAPEGVSTRPGDNYLEVFWNRNPESDIAGYHVFVSPTLDGRFDMIGTVATPYFLDSGARNGLGYYYAVTAFDFSGNESVLNRDIVFGVPRPEGYGIILRDVWLVPESSGFDFSTAQVVPFDDLYADMYFENFQDVLYMVVRSDDTDIQDAGYTVSLLDINIAPESGWSPTHDVQLVEGHTYIVWTWDNHYAKFRVTGLSSGQVVIDWAYQLQEANPILKQNAARDREKAAQRLQRR